MKAMTSAKDSAKSGGASPMPQWPEINPVPAVWESGAMSVRRPGAIDALYCPRKMDLADRGLKPPW